MALAGASARPELWAAGPGQVLIAVAAAAGTGASACVALTALLGPLFTTRRLVAGGEATALEALGWGRRDLAIAWLPLGLLAVVAAVGAGLVVEPAAWRVVHSVKGSPAMTAASWARLQAGEVAVLPDGGGLVSRGGALRFSTGDGAWTGELSNPRPDGRSWVFDAARARSSQGEEWSVDRLSLRPADDVAERWAGPPRSPWAASWTALRRRSDEPRAVRVLHRRLALVVAVVPLGLLGLCLGWSRRRGALLVAGGAPFAVFLAARLADTSNLPPTFAGWAPAVVAVGLAAVAWWRLPP